MLDSIISRCYFFISDGSSAAINPTNLCLPILSTPFRVGQHLCTGQSSLTIQYNTATQINLVSVKLYELLSKNRSILALRRLDLLQNAESIRDDHPNPQFDFSFDFKVTILFNLSLIGFMSWRLLFICGMPILHFDFNAWNLKLIYNNFWIEIQFVMCLCMSLHLF